MWLRFAFCVQYHKQNVCILLFVGFFAYDTLLSCLQLSLFSQNILKVFLFYFFKVKRGISTWCGSGGFGIKSWEPDSKYIEGFEYLY